jgi:hypothetical protein
MVGHLQGLSRETQWEFFGTLQLANYFLQGASYDQSSLETSTDKPDATCSSGLA